jgi:hypothetical protein
MCQIRVGDRYQSRRGPHRAEIVEVQRIKGRSVMVRTVHPTTGHYPVRNVKIDKLLDRSDRVKRGRCDCKTS